MQFPDLVLSEIFQFLYKEEKVPLRFVCSQWRLIIDRSLEIEYYCDIKNLSKQGETIQEMGRFITSTILYWDKFKFKETFIKNCPRLKVVDLICGTNQRNHRKALRSFNRILNQLHIKELRLTLNNRCRLDRLFTGLTLTKLKLRFELNDQNHGDTMTMLSDIEAPGLIYLRLTLNELNHQMSTLIEIKFPKLQKLKLDPYNLGEMGDGDLVFVVPSLPHLQKFITRDNSLFRAASLPQPQNIPKLSTLVLYADQFTVNNPAQSIWKSVSTLVLHIEHVTWLGVNRHFPNVKNLDIKGPRDRIFPNYLTELTKLRSLKYLVIDDALSPSLFEADPALPTITKFEAGLENGDLGRLVQYCSKRLTNLTDLTVIIHDTGTKVMPNVETFDVCLSGLTRLRIDINRKDFTPLLMYLTKNVPNLKYLEPRFYDDLPSRFTKSKFFLASLEVFYCDTWLFTDAYLHLLKNAPKLWQISPGLTNSTIEELQSALGTDRYITSLPYPR